MVSTPSNEQRTEKWTSLQQADYLIGKYALTHHLVLTVGTSISVLLTNGPLLLHDERTRHSRIDNALHQLLGECLRLNKLITPEEEGDSTPQKIAEAREFLRELMNVDGASSVAEEFLNRIATAQQPKEVTPPPTAVPGTANPAIAGQASLAM